MRSLCHPLSAAGILAIALLLATPGTTAGGERVEVFGKGHAATDRPADTTDPPPQLTSEEAEHDPAVGVFFAGTADYVVHDGGHRVLPRKVDLSDYILWAVYGATLVAQGQATDTHPATATIVRGEAWGDEVIPVSVTPAEGASATLEAENVIGFSYSYLISGPAIAEASVQLEGNAYDIFRKPHQFHLSEHSGESVTASTEKTTGTSESEYSKLTATYSTNEKSGGASVGGEVGSTVADHDELAVNISRRFGKSGGSTGGSPKVSLKDVRHRKTPISHTYQVFSDGCVQLAARAAPRTDSVPASVVVRLSEFKIQNSLRVWKTIHDTYTPPPGSDPGSPGGVSTPGAGDGGAGGGGTGGGASPGGSTPSDTGGAAAGEPRTATDGSTPGETPSDAGADNEAPSAADQAASAVDASTLRVVATAPHGLAGEPGTVPGTLTLRSLVPAGRDLRFALQSDPAGALDLFAPRIEVPRGGRGGVVHFEGRGAGHAVVRLTQIEDDGRAGPLTLECPVTCHSIAVHASPRLWAATGESPWTCTRYRTLRVTGGQAGLPLYVGRLGFRGWEDEATSVGLSVDDPRALLGPLPGTLVIPPGTGHVVLPVAIADAEGSARLTFSAGEETVDLTLLVQKQRWAETGRVGIPAGAMGRIPFRLSHPEERPRMVTARVEPAGIVALEGGADGRAGESSLLAGETSWEILATAQAVGQVEVVLASEGLDPQVIPVTVVPATVDIGDGRVRLLDLHEVSGGALSITAPPGMVFAEAALAPEAREVLSLRGAGTGRLLVGFLPAGALTAPEILEIAFALEGPLPADGWFEIKDCFRRASAGVAPVPYRIAAR